MQKLSFPLPQRPDGIRGRVFGIVMEWLNSPSYRAAFDACDLQPSQRLLEIGFGTGAFLELVVKHSPDTSVAGVDPSETMYQVALRRLKKLPDIDLAQIRTGLDHPLPWPNNAFNVVIAIHSFQFWENPEKSISEICRVLAPGGRLVFVLRSHPHPPNWLPNPISRSPEEVNELIGLLEQFGLKTIELDPSGSSRIIVAMV